LDSLSEYFFRLFITSTDMFAFSVILRFTFHSLCAILTFTFCDFTNFWWYPWSPDANIFLGNAYILISLTQWSHSGCYPVVCLHIIVGGANLSDLFFLDSCSFSNNSPQCCRKLSLEYFSLARIDLNSFYLFDSLIIR
jgi:hypothetical protein